MTLADEGHAPERLRAPTYRVGFELLGIQPVVGRTFLPEDDQLGAAGAAILSEDVWANRYGRDPGVLGRSVRVNGRPVTIVGVVATRYPLVPRTAIWRPLMQMPNIDRQERTSRSISLLGQGRKPRAARAEQKRSALSAPSANLTIDVDGRPGDSSRN